MTIQDNINCRDSAGRNSTPLHLAAGYNNLEVAEYLLEQVRNCTLPEVTDETVQYLEVEA